MGMFDLEGRVALVSGSSRGIGFAIAEAFAEAGAHVVLNGRNAETIAERAEELKARGLAASSAVADATDDKAVEDVVARTVKEHGRLDIAVANAGIQNRTPFLELSTEDARHVIDTNLLGVLVLARETAKAMADGGWGRLIFIGSIMGQVGRPTVIPYTAAKAGVMGMVKSLAVELGPMGINVNAIGPGFISTEMTSALAANAEFNAWIEERTALRRWGDPKEIAAVAQFLASEASSYLTGQTITVDGGQTAMA